MACACVHGDAILWSFPLYFLPYRSSSFLVAGMASDGVERDSVESNEYSVRMRANEGRMYIYAFWLQDSPTERMAGKFVFLKGHPFLSFPRMLEHTSWILSISNPSLSTTPPSSPSLLLLLLFLLLICSSFSISYALSLRSSCFVLCSVFVTGVNAFSLLSVNRPYPVWYGHAKYE